MTRDLASSLPSGTSTASPRYRPLNPKELKEVIAALGAIAPLISDANADITSGVPRPVDVRGLAEQIKGLKQGLEYAIASSGADPKVVGARRLLGDVGYAGDQRTLEHALWLLDMADLMGFRRQLLVEYYGLGDGQPQTLEQLAALHPQYPDFEIERLLTRARGGIIQFLSH